MAGPARFCGNFLVVSAFTTSLYANFLAYPFLFAVILLAVAALFAINVFLARYPRFWFGNISSDLNLIYKIPKYLITLAHPTNFRSLQNPDSSTHHTISERLKYYIFVIIQSAIGISCNLMPTWDAGKVCQVFRRNNLLQYIFRSGELIALRFYY